MKIIDGTSAALGRLASYVAKEALRGEEIAVLNCEKVIITGSKKDILRDFAWKRSMVGSSQKGPKYPKTSERIVKRTIRGMMPDHREGRGKVAFKRIKCYNGIPNEFEGKKMETMVKKANKFVEIKEVSRCE